MPQGVDPIVEISRAVVGEMIAHQRDEAPNECCGLLIGRGWRVHSVRRARNDRASPTRYVVNPEDHFTAMRAARAAGLEVIGAYHSHPVSPSVPSAVDLAESGDPSFLHIILSPGSPGAVADVRAYTIGPTGFRALRLEFLSDHRPGTW